MFISLSICQLLTEKLRQGKAVGDEYGNQREGEEKGRKQKEGKKEEKVKKGKKRSGGWWVMEQCGQGQEMSQKSISRAL